MAYTVRHGKLINANAAVYQNHARAKVKSELPADKGEYMGSCNVTACLAPGADYYNKSTQKHYCAYCAEKINWPGGRAEVMRLYGVPLLCELVEPPEQVHVDDWLDEPAKDEAEAMAKAWLEHFRRPAVDKDYVWLRTHPLYCTYGKDRFRVIGCSRLGDVWLTRDFTKENGYDKRISVLGCFDWSLKP